MRRFMILALTIALPLAPAAGCDAFGGAEEPGVSQLRQALPTARDMSIQLPQSSALVPEQALYYAFTRGVALHVNGLVYGITSIIEDVVEQRPTDTDNETYAVWGPWTAPLLPATYRVTVTTAADGFDYKVEGWPKSADESAAVVVLSGHHVPGEDANRGRGAWTYDLTAAHGLDPVAQESIGAISIGYTLGDDRALEVSFDGVQGPYAPQTTSALYRYTQAADGSGTLDFTSNLDIHHKSDAGLDRRELIQVRSRWLATGPGRADVVASHGDLPPDVTVDVTECWDAGFARSYGSVTYLGTEAVEGDAGTCPYADRQLPQFEGFDPDDFADGELLVALPDPSDLDVEPAPVDEEAPEVATYYAMAKATVTDLQLHATRVLELVHEITRHPASACDDSSCRWGPSTDWNTQVSAMLVVARQADGSYGYQVMVQRFGAGDDAWQVLLDGSAIDEGGGNGRGAFVYDFDVHAAFDSDRADAAGTLRVEYVAGEDETSLHFRHTDGPVEQEYLVSVSPEAGYLDLRGPFDLDTTDPARPLLEIVEGRVRWLSTGAGVADIFATSGDLGDDSEILAVECWNPTAARTHIDLVERATGDPATPTLDGPGCVFTDWQSADFPPMAVD
ncbi:MAG: hypothetical protein CSA66_03990 [Proteobacteria bacterium]|nr:MAG: hypothetical protein CSA66_03990 [Pseudomonadota bacterium]